MTNILTATISDKAGLAQRYMQRFLDWIKQEYRLTYYSHVRWKAEKGDPMAQYVLGTLCESGNGVFQTDAEAIKWYQKAAFKGIPRAQLAMGLRYLHGQGIGQSDSEAFLWLRKAADQGLADAQYEVAGLYWAGRGTQKDLVQARKWYYKAAESGYGDATKELEALNRSEAQGKEPEQADELLVA